MPTHRLSRLSPLVEPRQSHFFPRPFEFVGINVCPEGNCPAKSKHQLLETWPAPELVRDVAKFLGFVQFYSRFIPNFEIRVEALHTVTKQEYTEDVGPHWTQETQAAWEDLKGSILADPCIQRFDHCKLIVLRTNFSAKGFGYVLLQPGNDEASTNAAKDYLDGKGFTFMTKDSKAILHPVCNEIWLHSHLGEGFSGDYTINSFVWVKDCYAIKFILSYEGGNLAILRLQMRLMCWDVDIVHRPDTKLVDADYWSRLGVDIEFDVS